MCASLAVILAAHNRRVKTLQALRSLANQTWRPSRVDIYLFDDGSTDGTAEAVKREFPEAKILRGDGTAYWNGAMRHAFAAAIEAGYDLYLWLNDDTQLRGHCLRRLVDTHVSCVQRTGKPTIVVGSTSDPESGKLTYGGVRRTSRWRPLRFDLIHPASSAKMAETMNGNCVLIPADVVERVGNLDACFTHGMGDYDYGLRARAAGCEVWVAPGFVGRCSRNALPTSVTSGGRQFWRTLTGVKGLPPAEWRQFARRYAGVAWPLYFASPYVKRALAWAAARLSRIWTVGTRANR